MGERPADLALELGRVVPAPRPVVFAAFVEPEVLARWWGPAGFTVPRLELEAVAGGRYRIEMQPPDGDPFHLAGAFREVDAPARLVFTFAWEEPDPDDAETLVELAFRDAGGSTEVDLRQGPFRTEARRALHRDGWTESLDRLVSCLGGRDPGPPETGRRRR